MNLEVNQGLLKMDLSYPTDDEFNNLPIIWLTSPEPWEPKCLDEDDGTRILSPYKEDMNTNHMQKGDEWATVKIYNAYCRNFWVEKLDLGLRISMQYWQAVSLE